MAVEQGLLARLVRTSGFVKKELFSVIRQPRLLITLVVGPFLILLVFGLGYRDTPEPFKTLIVVESEDARLVADQEDLSEAFGTAIDLVGTSTDVDDARTQLENGEVDLLIVAPVEALAAIESGKRANFTIIHSEVDPVLRSSIGLLARLSVDEVNRRVLATILEGAQDISDEVESPAAGLSAIAGNLADALERGDEEAADAERQKLTAGIAEADASDTSGTLSQAIAEALGVDASTNFDGFQDQVDATNPDVNSDAVTSARTLESSLDELEDQLNRAQRLDPDILVAPFGTDVNLLTDVTPEPAIFYAPGVLVLLIQHLAITFAALSLVRERQLGLTEVFRVSPLSVTEALIGKYAAFVLITGVVGGVLAATLLAFGVPLEGSPLEMVAVTLLVIVASLGLGFLISGVSKTDSQAIQYSMLILLVSIFFTGFVLPLDQLIPAVRVLSFLLPGTYGILGLHDIMFRGVSIDPMIVMGLAGYALVMVGVAYFAVRKDVTLVGQ